jgi:hypothetical protein
MKCGKCKRSDPGVTVDHCRTCDGRQQIPASTFREPQNVKAYNQAAHAARKIGARTFNDQWEDMEREEREASATKVKRDSPSDHRRNDIYAELNTARDQIPEGSYALKANGDWKFYRIDKPQKGQWAGYTFLKEQAGSEYWPVKPLRRELEILLRIATNPAEASANYGHKIGACGICHHPLTKPESIARGIGPKCAGRMGW